MTIATFFDRTPATLRKPNTGTINRTTGKFTAPSQTASAIKIHVVQPNLLRTRIDEIGDGGAHIEKGDVFVFADTSIGIEPTDILEFWGSVYSVVTELRRFDLLDAVTLYKRRLYLVRKRQPDS